MRFKAIGIAVAIICSLCLFGRVLTSCVSAQLAIDNDPAEIINASAYVSIDSLSYDGSGEGVVDLSGTFFVFNYDQEHSITYSGNIRLEIFDMEGNAFLPHSEKEVSGRLEKNDEDALLSDVFDSIPKSTNLHMNCLSPKVEEGREYKMSANIALTVDAFRGEESWSTPYSTTFEHRPQADVEEQVGIGPTTDGETFSDDCTVDSKDDDDSANDEWTTWQSLIYTDGPYYTVYWYKKAPGDTSTYGSLMDIDYGDGAQRRATMTTGFPWDVDDPNRDGDQDAVWYEITAYVYRWDLSVYTTSYLVWVKDRK